MIPIQRGDEPSELVAIRRTELARIRDEMKDAAITSKMMGTQYQSVKEILWKAQHFKCCYCETQEQAVRNDVEHYRPKTRAKRHPGSADEHGYWWLAWSWENLLFSCRNCNQSPAKLDKFPLAEGSVALIAEQSPPGQEQPLLIDPATENGSEFIQFVPNRAGKAETCRWRPIGRNGSVRGQKTIEVCRLDRPDLLDLYADHVQNNIFPLVHEIQDAMTQNDAAAVQSAWTRALKVLLAPRQRFVGLSRDALDFWISPNMRQHWGLDLPTL